jgi:type II secretory pathway component PulF
MGILFSPRIGQKPLMNLCHRLGLALGAGIDLRTILAGEARRSVGSLQRYLTIVSEGVDRGESLSDALEPTGEFFPPLFRELIDVGEQTGHLDTVLAELSEHYRTRLALRRTFLSTIAWPVAELALVVVFIGFVIWLMGFLREMFHNPNLDVFQFGLIGVPGLVTYLFFVALAIAFVWLFIEGARRGFFWTRPLQRLLLRLPGFGKPLRTMALARMAWAMHLTIGAGMDIRRAMKLSFRSAQNAYYEDHIPAFDAEIAAGCTMHEAFRNLGGYPPDFLDTLAVGEDSGNISESMAVLARQYTDQARLAMTALAVAAGWAIWIGIATLIIVLIFRVFSLYLGALQGAMQR